MSAPRFAAVALAAAAALGAQPASSATWFLVGAELGAGGLCQSPRHRLVVGAAPGAAATAAGRTIASGMPGLSAVALGGGPIVTGVQPAALPLRGGAAATVHGRELDVGGATVRIAGVTATLQAASRHTLTLAATPALAAPGRHPVAVTTAAGDSARAGAAAVVPYLELPQPPRADRPLRLRCHAAAGDQVVAALAAAALPVPIPLPPFLHGLRLDPTAMLLLPALPVLDPGGVLDVVLPPPPAGFTLFTQAFVLSGGTSHGPGAFTDLAAIRG